ncbi:hypothetical protein J1N35_044458 [Gossypium stocksii]|uniref:Myb/SANT-like domain-containing protein n=1 Tax=Gossypium stocksii TaxID=47602 RepID=A0A9D3ZFS2_9ROSI|nr:hypothetical protein J1N35_044458 [Gossypium stocksii]
MLEKVLPHAMWKAKPKLELRIRTLKRDWTIVYDMLSGTDNTSFSWNEHKQMVVAEDVAKDRATRKNAKTIVDIVEEIDFEDVTIANNLEEETIIMDVKMMFPWMR